MCAQKSLLSNLANVNPVFVVGSSSGTTNVSGPEQAVRYSFSTSTAHSPLIFTHIPIARIALIPGQAGVDFTEFHEGNILHCGAVNSSGHVFHYSEQNGLKKSKSGWENCIIIRLTKPLCNGRLVSSSLWDQAIERHYEDQELWSRKNYSPQNSTPNEATSQDCLDFVVSVARMALGELTLDRIQISRWIASQLVHLVRCDDKQHS
ncbi:hypothetical protein FGIG_04723 [Fasciola gigantica]|uniref:MKRN2 opposite strand protein-like C-terminal domain-containing protein n=1 Tax=Fasciola gigantica TaxID=46835 RepID=A0A504Z3L8_FASGI|nr:hypothetical protein FGIG_04723 [Fasciola gigantica]